MLRILFALLFVCVVFAPATPLASQSAAPTVECVRGEILVCPKPNRSNVLTARLREGGCTVCEVDNVSGLLRVAVAEGREAAEVERWSTDGDVVFAERNGIVHGATTPNDTHFGFQWHLQNTGQSGGAPGVDIRACDAWALTTGSPNVGIAVLDTGIDSDHPDFAGRIDPDGYDFVNEDNDPEGDHPHGTGVTGVLAANGGNNFGVAGLDWQCRILPVKVLDSNNMGSLFDVVQGINYCAVQSDVQVLSMSLCYVVASPSMNAALQLARDNSKILIAASGNGGIGTADTCYPAASSLTMSVGATTNADWRAGFSGSGSTLDFVAPGVSIVTSQFGTSNNVFSFGSGTSLSTPIVAGIVGLVLARAEQLGLAPPTHEDVRQLLIAGALDQVGPAAQDPPGRDDLFGHGRIDARLVLDAVPSLRTCGDGAVGLAVGRSFPVLRVDGQATNGTQLAFPIQVGNAATLSIDVPPTLPQPGPVAPVFLLVASAGVAGTGSPVTLPFGWGEMCFDPSPANLILQYPGVAPWSAATPPMPMGFTASLQALMFDSPQADIAVSNLVVLEALTLPSPIITGLMPPTAVAGTTVGVDGAGFQQGITMTIDSVAVPLTAVTSTQVSFVVPVGLSCDATLVLSNPDSQTVSTAFNASPSVSGFSAPSGTPAAGGTLIFISGSGFVPGMTVTVGGAAATVVSSSAGFLLITLPPGSVGSAVLQLTTPSGCTGTFSLTYTP